MADEQDALNARRAANLKIVMEDDYGVTYPEHERQRKVLDDAGTIGNFLEWLEGQGVTLTCLGDDDEPMCRKCRRTEVKCAEAVLRGGCCPACSHWTSYTADGDPKVRVVEPPRTEHGTERAYREHWLNHQLPCLECRLAHFRFKKWFG